MELFENTELSERVRRLRPSEPDMITWTPAANRLDERIIKRLNAFKKAHENSQREDLLLVGNLLL